MRLNIKDPEAHRLAKAIAEMTGESLTKVVIDSLEERRKQLEQCPKATSLEELMAIARRVSRSVNRQVVDHDVLLYDEHGLPH
jgi:antitoxin VapB